jgi:hypothetical protein
MLSKPVSRKMQLAIGVTLVYVLAMVGWLLWDGVVQVAKVSHLPALQFWQEPIVWHKLGEPLLALPIAAFLAGGYPFWRSDFRARYIHRITPLTIIGGICEFIAATLFYQRGNTDFIFWFSLVLGVTGLLAPIGLWMAHQHVIAKENAL